jgi:hypothetical protein
MIGQGMANPSPKHLARQDERAVIGLWFAAIADLVNSCPSRVATSPGCRIEYDRATVSYLSGAFNNLAKSRQILSPAQRVVAARHIYRISPRTAWREEDEHALEAAAKKAADGVIDDTPAATKQAEKMTAQMKFLFKVCNTHRIGVTVHTPEPGVICINLVPQERPRLNYNIKPPGWMHNRTGKPGR